jgi:hypothetical protein
MCACNVVLVQQIYTSADLENVRVTRNLYKATINYDSTEREEAHHDVQRLA